MGGLKMFDRYWFLWLTLVSVWNFGWPGVLPIYDIIVAVILSIGIKKLKDKNV